MAVLTAIDVTGIQNYVFGSNRLRESIGASEIVAQATSEWVFDVLRDEFKEKTNIKATDQKYPFEMIDKDKKIESGSIVAEVIYAGGGNTVIVFASIDEARRFTRRYTRLLLECAPGLDVVIAHSKDFDMNDGDEETGKRVILTRMDEAFRLVNQKKGNRQFSTPLLGLAVTSQCVSTGGVASYNLLDLLKGNENKKLRKALQEKYRSNQVSAETFAKLKAAREASIRLKEELFTPEMLKGLDIPSEFDDLGRTHGEASFIAIVHTDGNGMGKRVKEARAGTTNRKCIEKIRDFSESIHKANLAALKEVLEKLSNHLNPREGKWFFQNQNNASFQLSQNKEQDKTYYFPFRPLIFGGDDLTFVCDGRLALALTALYLEALAAKRLSDEPPLFARAGVAIVKVHYPFKRAYDLAEDLAKSAKARIKEIDREQPDSEKGQFAAFDWHVAMSGLLGNIAEIRQREYMPQIEKDVHSKLFMRPLALQSKEPQAWRSWGNFKRIIAKFQTPVEWQEKRNKLKALRESLRCGEEKVKEFRKLYRLGELPKIEGEHHGIEKSGWGQIDEICDEKERRCGYFDAIEMIDLFFSLDETNKAEAAGGTST